MSANVKVIQELGEVSGPRTIEDQLKALHEAQTFLTRLFDDKAAASNGGEPAEGAAAPEGS